MAKAKGNEKNDQFKTARTLTSEALSRFGLAVRR